MIALIYTLSVLVAGALYITGAVPTTLTVFTLQVVCWIGGYTFARILRDREEAEARA